MKHIGLCITDSELESTLDSTLETLTVNQLKELAAAEDIDLGAAKTKAEIIAIISAAKE